MSTYSGPEVSVKEGPLTMVKVVVPESVFSPEGVVVCLSSGTTLSGDCCVRTVSVGLGDAGSVWCLDPECA